MTLIAAQGMVRRFHEMTGSCIAIDDLGFREVVQVEYPAKGREIDFMRMKLISEESHETCEAIMSGDFPEAIDGLCDLIYICLGTAVTWGVDLDPIFRAVHAANMAKTGGLRRADGKILKPDGWTPPDVAGLLRAQGWTP